MSLSVIFRRIGGRLIPIIDAGGMSNPTLDFKASFARFKKKFAIGDPT